VGPVIYKICMSPLGILSIRQRDWGHNGCLGRGGYLGIERVGTGGKGRKGGFHKGGWVWGMGVLGY
jgi:hypothetical protein